MDHNEASRTFFYVLGGLMFFMLTVNIIGFDIIAINSFASINGTM
jgi:hypothetical protein